MICCAAGCGHKAGCGCHFYNFPSPNDGPEWEKWYDIWVLRINKVNADGSLWRPETPNTKLCSCHFRPEDQWDPKSRKGGLKCKEPVFFGYSLSFTHVSTSPTPAESHQQQSGDATSTDGNDLKHPWYATSLLNVSAESSDEPEAKNRSVQSPLARKKKCKTLFTSSRMPPLKIREYFEKQDGTTCEIAAPTTNSVKNASEGARKRQYFTSDANFPIVQDSLSNDSDGQGINRVDVGNLQVIEPGVVDTAVIEVIDSDDNTQDMSSVHQVGIKHEKVDSSESFVHTASTTCGRQTTSPLCVKIEMDGSPLVDDSILEYEEVIPGISTHSVECHDMDQEQGTDQQMSHFTPRENVEVILPKNTTHRAKISNVKPIRVFTSKNLALDLTAEQGIMSLESLQGEEGINSNKNIQSENVYDQMFNKLMVPGSRFLQETVQTSVSQDNVVNIVDMLSDPQTCTVNGHPSLNQAVNRIKELEKALSVERFGLRRFCGSDEKIKFYTGFRSADTLMRFFWRIEPDDLTSERSCKWRDALTFAKEMLQESVSSEDISRKVIPYMDELFLFLCHVWLGLQPEDLADRFALPSSSYAHFIILRWIYYLKATLPSTAERTKSTSTTSKFVRFQGQYSNTKLLLHHMKIKVQQESIINHLSSARLNALVGFSSSGEVVFTSDVMSEVFSNRDLLQNSGVLSLLQRGDGVTFEGEFVRDDLLSSVGVTVHHLPDFDMPHDPTAFQLGSSTRNSHVCHTEVVRLLSAKYVSGMTGFKCFQSVVLHPFSHSIRDLWEVCCRLVNYQQGHRSL